MKELIRINSSLKHVIDLYVKSASADSGPPLGTVLGNLGVNSAKFVKDFNEFTKHLPSYFVLRVRIYIYENRTASFLVFCPASSFLLNALKYHRPIKITHFDRIHEKALVSISIKNIVHIALFKFPGMSLKKAISVI